MASNSSFLPAGCIIAASAALSRRFAAAMALMKGAGCAHRGGAALILPRRLRNDPQRLIGGGRSCENRVGGRCAISLCGNEYVRRSAMTQKYTRVERKGRITTVTISRPEVLNALHTDAHYELHEAFDAFAADPEQWVAIITGAGDRAFCAGHDLKLQASGGHRGTPPTGFGGLTKRFDLTKPLIAAVNGVAMGGGFEIALACDLIVASETAIFALPEVRVGLAALAGGLHRLPRQIGLKRAMGMILTARRVSAQEGLEFGFVNEVVAPNDLMRAAEHWANTICQNSPMSVRASKEAVLKGLEEPLEQAIAKQTDYAAIKAMVASQDYIEGPRAFAEKRPPQWLGR
jgi:enoyl-CoA hydratase/carnithine racemase